MKINSYILLGVFYALGCAQKETSIGQQLQQELDKTVASKFAWTPGVSLSVYAPEDAFIWTGTAGVSNLETNTTFMIDQPFRIASAEKTILAAAIFRLQEKGQLSIADPISKYISPYHDSLLVADGYATSRITIRHCLNLSGGFYDYVFGTDELPSPYIKLVRADPNKEWTRTELIEGTVKWGEPLGKAGTGRCYGATDHIILGEIVENIMGMPLGPAFRALLHFDDLGMPSTWQETIELSRNELPQVSCYYRRINYSDLHATTNLYGGGLVSTTADLSKFFYHLFAGDVFQNPATIELMKERLNPDDNLPTPDDAYRLGLEARSLYGQPVWGHSGMWDTFVYYFPKNKLTIAIHFTDGGNDYLIKRVISILDQYQESR